MAPHLPHHTTLVPSEVCTLKVRKIFHRPDETVFQGECLSAFGNVCFSEPWRLLLNTNEQNEIPTFTDYLFQAIQLIGVFSNADMSKQEFAVNPKFY